MSKRREARQEASGEKRRRRNRTYTVLTILLILFGSNLALGKDFKLAEPGYRYHFPEDHGSHEAYQIEWWYFTGHLYDKKGGETGFELTFFRTGIENDLVRQNPSHWRVMDIYSAHFALSKGEEKQFWFGEKISRDALGRGGSKQDHFQVWIDKWRGEEKEGLFYLSASDGSGKNRKGIELQLKPEGAPVVHGDAGVSPKDIAASNRSHYYSYPRLKTAGKLIWNGAEQEIEGISWMDHEFGSKPLLPSQTGWDWFSIQLKNQTELMLYQIRNLDGSSPFSFGTLIEPDGKVINLRKEEITLKPTLHWKSSRGVVYPVGWEVTIPGKNISLALTPLFENQELTVFGGKMRYWEGSVGVTGSPGSGTGYLELTGYANDFSRLFSQ